jgi:hypothetical protein
MSTCECCGNTAPDVKFYEAADGWDGVCLCDDCEVQLPRGATVSGDPVIAADVGRVGGMSGDVVLRPDRAFSLAGGYQRVKRWSGVNCFMACQCGARASITIGAPEIDAWWDAHAPGAAHTLRGTA